MVYTSKVPDTIILYFGNRYRTVLLKKKTKNIVFCNVISLCQALIVCYRSTRRRLLLTDETYRLIDINVM